MRRKRGKYLIFCIKFKITFFSKLYSNNLIYDTNFFETGKTAPTKRKNFKGNFLLFLPGNIFENLIKFQLTDFESNLRYIKEIL